MQFLNAETIGFPIGDGLSIEKLHLKSVIFAVPLNFQNSIPGQPASEESLQAALEGLFGYFHLDKKTIFELKIVVIIIGKIGMLGNTRVIYIVACQAHPVVLV